MTVRWSTAARRKLPAGRGLTVAEAAEHYNCSERTIRRRIADGTLRAWRVGPKLIRLDPADLERMARRIPAAGNGG
jgi:excisionase family DNA binding protein